MNPNKTTSITAETSAGEKFIPDKTGDFAPAPDRDMRTGEPIYDPETDEYGNPKFAQSIGFEVGAGCILSIAETNSFTLESGPTVTPEPTYLLTRLKSSQFMVGGVVNFSVPRSTSSLH